MLSTTVAAGDCVYIVTGAGIAPALPSGETDGPPGAAALARALILALGARPLLVTETLHAPPVLASADAASPSGHHIDTLTIDPRQCDRNALDELLAVDKPAVVIFVERDGANGTRAIAVDGIGIDAHAGVVELMRVIAAMAH